MLDLCDLSDDQLDNIGKSLNSETFSMVGADGEQRPVRIHAWGRRSKVFSFQIDLIGTGWCYRNLNSFNEEMARYTRMSAVRPKIGRTETHDSGVLLNGYASQADRVRWLRRAIQFTCDSANLEHDPEYLKWQELLASSPS